MAERLGFNPDKKPKKVSAEEEERLFKEDQTRIAKQPKVPSGTRLKTSDTTWRKVAALSLALHGGAVEAAADFPITKNIASRATQIVRNPRELTIGFFSEVGASEKNNSNEGLFDTEGEGSAPDSDIVHADILKTLEQGKNFTQKAWGIDSLPLERGAHGEVRLAKDAYWQVDFKKFFLTHEFKRGEISRADARRIAADFDKQLVHYRERQSELSKEVSAGHLSNTEADLRLIHEIVSDQGDYDPDQPLFSKTIDSSQPSTGDCKARAKRPVAFLTRLFGSGQLDIRLQISNDPHVRVVVRVDQEWYVVEDVVRPLQPDEIRGRVFVDPGNYIASEFGLHKDSMLPPSHESPDTAGPGGKNDGFDLLSPGVKPTKNVFGSVARTPEAKKFIKKTFEEAQTAYQKPTPELEVVYLDADELTSSEPSAPLRSEFEPKRISLTPQEIITTEVTGEITRVGADIGSLFSSRPDDEVYPQAAERYDRFKQLSSVERARFLRESVVDLSPLKDIPIRKLRLEGGKADLGQLQNWDNLREVSMENTYLTGLENLTKAKDLEKLQWNGWLYPVQEIPSVEKKFAQALPTLKNLKNLELENAPLTNLEYVRGLPIEVLRISNLNVGNFDAVATLPLKQLYLGRLANGDLSALKGVIDNLGDGFSASIQSADGDPVFGGLGPQIIKNKYQANFVKPKFTYDEL